MRRSGIHWTSLAVGGALLAMAMQALQTNAPPPLPPPPSANARLHRGHLSPVEYFRALLGMSAAERERALAGRSPADRAVLLAKLKEYEALPRAIREARLCQTELHWELSDLMKLAPGDRTNRLKEVSALYRPMIDNLLRQWDLVPVNTQKELLARQNFIGLYLRMQGSPAAAQKEILETLPPERRAHWAEEMDRWQSLPEQERADLCAQFQRFCAMNGKEQKETVGPLPDAERQVMDKTLKAYDGLVPAQRAQCINSFRKFATMTPEQRTQFMKNAAHWEAMTGHERQLWREMVHKLPPMPPMPPGMLPMPPMPQRSYQAGARHMPPMPPSVTAPVFVAFSTNSVR